MPSRFKPDLVLQFFPPLVLVHCLSLPVPVSSSKGEKTMASPVAKVAKAVCRVGSQLQNFAAPATVNATQKRHCKFKLFSCRKKLV